MLIIRLQRVGKKNDPSFRVVLTDSRRAPQSGGFLEILGSYDARKGEPQLKAGRIQHWLGKGVQTSGTVHNLLLRAKLITGDKIRVSPLAKKRPPEAAVTAPVSAPETPAAEARLPDGQAPAAA